MRRAVRVISLLVLAAAAGIPALAASCSGTDSVTKDFGQILNTSGPVVQGITFQVEYPGGYSLSGGTKAEQSPVGVIEPPGNFNSTEGSIVETTLSFTPNGTVGSFDVSFTSIYTGNPTEECENGITLTLYINAYGSVVGSGGSDSQNAADSPIVAVGRSLDREAK